MYSSLSHFARALYSPFSPRAAPNPQEYKGSFRLFPHAFLSLFLPVAISPCPPSQPTMVERADRSPWAVESESSDANDILSDSSDLSDLSSPPTSPQTPPEFYPSPPPSQLYEEASRSRPSGQEPARKKRRVSGPKPRTTQHLDLTATAQRSREEQREQIDCLVKTLRRHRKIIVIAGAGISTSAGIPDFRSADGLFKSLQKKHNLKASGKLLFDAAVYRDDSLTASFHEMVRKLSEEAARSSPTPFHHMLARMARENRLCRLYTQNIDCLETSIPPLATQVPLNSKAPWPRTIQLHGSLDKMICQKCRHMSDFRPELFIGPDAPACPACSETDEIRTTTGQRSHGVGKMRPRIVLYNEHNPDEEAIASVMNADIRSRPDAVVVVGTSLKIPGVRRLVKSLCKVVRSRRNGVAMWINNEPPSGKEFEDCWDLIVKSDCDTVARLVNLKNWDDDSPDTEDESVSELQKKSQDSTPEAANTPKDEPLTGIPTPSPSQDDDSQLPHKKPKQPSSSKPATKQTSLFGTAPKAPSSKDTKKKPTTKGPSTKAPKASTAKPPVKPTTKITAFSKVTKATTSVPAGKDAKKKSGDDTHKPMQDIRPEAVRNNSPVFPNLVNWRGSAKEGRVEQATIEPSATTAE